MVDPQSQQLLLSPKLASPRCSKNFPTRLRVVVNDLAVRLVEAGCQVSLGNSQADSIADTLSQGTCMEA
jgi:hypothetical protein